jgi:hypothetical protein
MIIHKALQWRYKDQLEATFLFLYTRLLFHLVGGDLVGGVEDGRCSSDRRLDGVVDIV